MKFSFLQSSLLLSLAGSVQCSLRGGATQRELNTGGSWLSILNTSFESGVATDFEVGVNAVEHNMGIGSAQDQAHVIKLDNSGPESVITSKSIDVSAFDRVEVSFYYAGESLEDGDSFVMEFQNDDTGPWRTAKNFIQATATKDMNGSWHHQRLQWLTHDGIQNVGTVKIRIRAQGDSADDTFFIDSFEVLGRSSATPAPTPEPSPEPTPEPTADPTASPTKNPTASPTKNPTAAPTGNPTKAPSPAPTGNPTAAPTKQPSAAPTKAPSAAPTKQPSATPTAAPTKQPSPAPTAAPTKNPTATPTAAPTKNPTLSPVAVTAFECTAAKRGNKGKVRIEWDGAEGTRVDVYRDNSPNPVKTTRTMASGQTRVSREVWSIPTSFVNETPATAALK